MIQALRTELIMQKDFLENQKIETIYFGGGTPSLLSAEELHFLLSEISSYFEVLPSAEITLEANPDDLNPQKVKELKQTAINRFSIGIQSFFEEDLLWMNRAHNSQEAESSIKRVQDAGFENITLDLIYGYPLLTNEKWLSNISRVLDFNVPHISAYSMTVEPATALASFINKGKQQPMNESQSAEQFILLMKHLQHAGFEQYEISNFAKPGMISKHNSNYWKGISYLGIGPSAHSYNGKNRSWNISNNVKYIRSIENGSIPAEMEVLTINNKINEYIMTSLRTSWGMDLDFISNRFGSEYLKLVENTLQLVNQEWIKKEEKIVVLSQEGKLYADRIASELFIDADFEKLTK
jgi:oxygen-independent coproporphyrinogen III oxidase